jgi:hypothetical protein
MSKNEIHIASGNHPVAALKTCPACGGTFNRRRPDGRLLSDSGFSLIKYCSRECAHKAITLRHTTVSERDAALLALHRGLLDRYSVDNDSHCWEWTGTIGVRGYGRLGIMGRSYLAHRLSLLAHGYTLGDAQHALHRCDNPRCINPDHLYAGTHADNMRDAVQRGRINMEPAHKAARALSDESVRYIRQTYVKYKKPTQSELAQRFGVDRATIARIVNKRGYLDVSE